MDIYNLTDTNKIKLNKNELTNKNFIKRFYNTKLSCSYDSFCCIFANNIFSSIYNIDYNNKNYYEDDFNHILFLYMMDFIIKISTMNFICNSSFYNTYINYVNEETDNFKPITTLYRPFWNNKFFTIMFIR